MAKRSKYQEAEPRCQGNQRTACTVHALERRQPRQEKRSHERRAERQSSHRVRGDHRKQRVGAQLRQRGQLKPARRCKAEANNRLTMWREGASKQQPTESNVAHRHKAGTAQHTRQTCHRTRDRHNSPIDDSSQAYRSAAASKCAGMCRALSNAAAPLFCFTQNNHTRRLSA